jgi:hypothetical protein
MTSTEALVESLLDNVVDRSKDVRKKVLDEQADNERVTEALLLADLARAGSAHEALVAFFSRLDSRLDKEILQKKLRLTSIMLVPEDASGRKDGTLWRVPGIQVLEELLCLVKVSWQFPVRFCDAGVWKNRPGTLKVLYPRLASFCYTLPSGHKTSEWMQGHGYYIGVELPLNTGSIRLLLTQMAERLSQTPYLKES